MFATMPIEHCFEGQKSITQIWRRSNLNTEQSTDSLRLQTLCCWKGRTLVAPQAMTVFPSATHANTKPKRLVA
jgi:hypothetical protein